MLPLRCVSRRRNGLGPLLLLLAGLLSPTALGDLPSELRAAIGKGRPPGSSLAVSIRDIDRASPIFELDADRAMIPASNMKVLTTGASLVSLGPEFRFRTRIRLVDRGASAPELHIDGDGDPALADPQLLSQVTWTRPDGSVQRGLDANGFLDAWVASVADTGVRGLSDVVADDRVFEREGFHPQWPRDQFAERYCSEVRGLNFHHNVLEIWPVPRPGGKAAVGRMSPEMPFLPLENRTTSNRASSAKHTFWVGRPFDRNDLTLNGNVQVAPADPVAITLHDMPSLLAEMLARRLRAAGVTVQRARTATDGDVPGAGRPVGPPIETPIATVLLRCNTDSDNLAAESLLKRVVHHETGRPGSWTEGSSVLPQVLSRRLSGPESLRGLVVSDGSGLSRANRVSASLMTELIASIDSDPRLSGAFRESLAVGGETGTVRTRFRSLGGLGATVLCKTGYIRGVSCLSGIVIGENGRRVAFSVLGNDLNAANAVGRMKELQERIVLEIAQELEAPKSALGG